MNGLRIGVRETAAPKIGKNGAVLLAEELQAAKRRMAHGLCRQKEEPSQRFLRALQEPHGKK